MSHLNTEVGRMLIQIEQRLQAVQNKIMAAIATGQSYEAMRLDMAQRSQLRKMVAELEAALAISRQAFAFLRGVPQNSCISSLEVSHASRSYAH